MGENDITTQTEFVFEQIQRALEAAGGSLRDVIKTNIYVTDMSKRPQVVAVRKRYFPENPPVATFVEVSKLVNDGFMIEIEAEAVVQL